MLNQSSFGMNVLGVLDAPVFTIVVRGDVAVVAVVVAADADADGAAVVAVDADATGGGAIVAACTGGFSAGARTSDEAVTTAGPGLSFDDMPPRANHRPTVSKAMPTVPTRTLLRDEGELAEGVEANPPRDSLPAPVVTPVLGGAAVTPEDVSPVVAALGSVRIDAGTASRDPDAISVGDL